MSNFSLDFSGAVYYAEWVINQQEIAFDAN